MGENNSKAPPAVVYEREEDVSNSVENSTEAVQVIEVDITILDHCDALRLQHSDIKWMLLKIADRNTIKLDASLVCNEFDRDFQEESEIFQALVEQLPADEPRYVVFNFNVSSKKDKDITEEKLAFIYWRGSDCDKRELALYDSSKHLILQQLGQAVTETVVCDKSELVYDSCVNTILQRKSRLF